MKFSDKIIAGGGISGLIWKYYNPEFQIISPDIGGLYARTHMVWLHDCVETRKLLTDLGWKNVASLSKKSYVGYYKNGWISEILTPDLNLKLIQKKMTDWDQILDTSFVPKTRDLSLSSSGELNYMNSLDVDLEEVVKRLNKDAEIVNGTVAQLGSELAIIRTPDGEHHSVPYDELVSTVPAPIFWSMWGTKKDFRFKPITNVITSKKPKFFDNNFEMLYLDETEKPTRVSHLGGKFALEFTGIITETQFKAEYPELPIEEYFIVRQGRIFEDEPNIPPTGKIRFVGRFASWRYGITTENVLKDALDYKVNKTNEK